ncbi:hypothetical protein M427DRAFT_401159 [Gonapodya prolifera JEL478]|uniref:Uncharacterized protein n=1 Tax=Gonapodya prolifera (strain JEL478) TaxID=1344416 RepID=A0A139ATJ8_GONPJ|nr:hypothetical protein M427DRAFT_401159 [Gonapodya prolifera JEL478]|eukprot:KXS20060.1 hypothetical protein M427DRAFT_401159 [Gonapodya prolifera JEL478]
MANIPDFRKIYQEFRSLDEEKHITNSAVFKFACFILICLAMNRTPSTTRMPIEPRHPRISSCSLSRCHYEGAQEGEEEGVIRGYGSTSIIMGPFWNCRSSFPGTGHY